jgi:hypothetical protein
MTNQSPDTRLTNYATVEAHCADFPVYAFGYTYVYAVSPDFDPGARLQMGNDRPWRKIMPKKSWEIRNNKLGSTPAREPKTAANDDQPLLAVHLIDGDPDTLWCSRGQTQPTVQPEWIRVDLPWEQRVKAVALVPRREALRVNKWPGSPAGQALPGDLVIKVSQDGWHWQTVYENHSYGMTRATVPQVFEFAARQVKQVWITGTDLIPVLNFGHCFSVAGVEVWDEDEQNLALVSRGAGVTVSSTHTGYGMDRFTQDMLWPLQYDLGYKWSRVGYDMGVFTWAYVEREKGRLVVDPRADDAISEAVANGINVIMCLDKGNWLYAPEPKRKDRTRELMETYYDRPPEPVVNPEYLSHYLDYVRFMVRHFRDRVKYYEVMNEWHESVGTPEEYCILAKAAIKVIRDEYPEAKILPASPGGFQRGFIEACLKQGLGPLVDVIAWHPFYHPDVLDPSFKDYAQQVREFKKLCASHGFRGEYMATEWAWSAPYPVPPWGPRPGNVQASPISELSKAKYAAQLTIRHVGLDMVSLWNETFQTQLSHWSISLLRNTFSADPLPPTQPEVIYYVQRTLATVLEDVRPLDFPVQCTSAEHGFESWTFGRSSGEHMLALWHPGIADDRFGDAVTDIVLPGIRAQRVVGIDVLNGREQDLDSSLDGNSTILKGILVKDCPIVLRF